jgi:hypothetical protein
MFKEGTTDAPVQNLSLFFVTLGLIDEKFSWDIPSPKFSMDFLMLNRKIEKFE